MGTITIATIIAATSVFLLLRLVYAVIWRLKLSPLAKFPGPKLAALTTCYECYFDVFQGHGGNYIWEIQRMHEKYGPIVRISPFELHVHDRDFYQEIYTGSNRRRDKYFRQTRSGGTTQAIGFTVNHYHHRIRRQALEEYFSQRNVVQLEKAIVARIDVLCDHLEGYTKNGRPVNLTNAYLALTIDLIETYAFGRSSDLLSSSEFDSRWRNTVTSVMKNTATMSHFGWLPKLFNRLPDAVVSVLAPEMAELFALKRKIFDQVIYTLSNDFHKRLDADVPRTIFEELKSNGELPPQETTAERLTDEATILVIAASETPAKVLSIIYFHLMDQPKLMKALRTELCEVTAAETTKRNHELPLSRLQQLPYLTAVIKEGLRLHGGIVARTQRIAVDEELHFKTFAIPRGTPLSMSSYFIHRDPEIFPDPHEFNPERWIGNSVAAIPRTNSTSDALPGTKHPLDQYLVAFGRGTRNCIGKNLGYAELYLALARIVPRFDMTLFRTDISDVEMERDWYVMQPRFGSEGVRANVQLASVEPKRL